MPPSTANCKLDNNDDMLNKTYQVLNATHMTKKFARSNKSKQVARFTQAKTTCEARAPIIGFPLVIIIPLKLES